MIKLRTTASTQIEQRTSPDHTLEQEGRVDHLAGLISHDLRNPINVAKGHLRLAKEEDTPTSEAESHLDAVARALDRMDEIVEDVLTLTWGRQTLGAGDLDPLHLASVAETSWDYVDTSQVALQIEDDPCLWAHEGRLQRLLENLFRNVVEHGGKNTTVHVGKLSDGFFVEDDGPGIPPEKREKVFETGYSSGEEGTGLGLSIVAAIGDAHGWSLTATEGRDGGARFEVRGVDLENRVVRNT